MAASFIGYIAVMFTFKRVQNPSHRLCRELHAQLREWLCANETVSPFPIKDLWNPGVQFRHLTYHNNQ